MQFLICVIDHATGSASETEMAAIDEFNERLVWAGYWVFAGGLHPPESAVHVDGRPNATVPTAPLRATWPESDPPEYVSGFWIVDVPNPEIAHRLAVDGSRACNRRVELRQFL
jgi:hypothetical protein